MINQHDSFIWFKINGITRYILAHTLSKVIPIYIVNEYPKSGGSWVAEMLSDILSIPFPRNRLPMLKKSIMHEHKMHKWNTNKNIIVWRDGRDVMVSHYFHSLFFNERGNKNLVEKCQKELNFEDKSDSRNNLPKFIEYLFTRNKAKRITWSKFVNNWYNDKNSIHIKYENIISNPYGEMVKILRDMGLENIEKPKITESIKKHNFENVTGRKPGVECKKSFARKGIVGDWKNHFSKEAKIAFANYAGRELILLGYEENYDWVC